MAVVQTIRPEATVSLDRGTIVDTTVHGALSDDSDATYVENQPLPAGESTTFLEYVVRADEDGPGADHELHRIRMRQRRVEIAAGPVSFSHELRIERPLDNVLSSSSWDGSFVNTSIATHDGPYRLLDVALDGALTGFVYRWVIDQSAQDDGEGEPDPDWRNHELYAVADWRHIPTFTPDVEDGADNSVAGGTLTDTNQARLVFGAIDYDSLTARSWTVEVEDSGGAIVFSDSGSGTPPSEIVTDPLANDSYTARFQAFSTIRQDDAFASDVESVTFTVSFVPPNAPECTVTPTADPPSIEVCWTDPTSPGFSPGDTEWDDESEVVSEVRRTDCNGTETIYVALTYEDCHVDRFMGLSFAGSFCGEDDHVCQVCYEVRWWGRIDGILVATEWSTPCCVASIDNPEPGCDWLRGASSGDICVCTDRTYERTRPFGSFQPIGGGLPTVVTGTPGGRNYTLSFPVESEADLDLVESILDQPLNYFQPDDQRDLWMAPNPESVNVTKIKRLRVVQASFVEVEPNPLADPASLVPPASGSP